MGRTNDTCYCNNQEIEDLIKEEKYGPSKKGISELKALQGGIKESKTTLTGENGNTFLLIINYVHTNEKPFSITLAYKVDSTTHLNLLRYDGFDTHKNHIEGKPIRPGTHIHKATERYQRSNIYYDDGFAKPTDRYETASEALQCLINDCNIIFEDNRQITLL